MTVVLEEKNAGAIWCYGICKHCKDDGSLK